MKFFWLSLFLILSLLFFSYPCFAFDLRALHEEADRTSSAEALARTARSKNSPDAWYVLGLTYLNEHKDDLARSAFGRVHSMNPASVAGRWGEAEVLRRKHQLRESEKILHDIIVQSPQFSPAYITLAYIKFTNTDYAIAVSLAKKVIAQGKENVDINNYTRAYLIVAGSRGMLAHYGGPIAKVTQGTRVFSMLKKAESFQPFSSGVYFGLGSFYFLAPFFVGGNIDIAAEYFIKAITADPLFADSYARLAQVYKLKNDTVRYHDLIKKALDIDPGNELALDVQSGRCSFICP
ncbi:MAG: hypothetical protein ABH865_04185 [Candidatus Omnitrophota bacterium]|nr:hypothetical protein [Candidatus Omnitrophota bacterium]